MFEDLKINKVVIGTQIIEDYWIDKGIDPIQIVKVFENNKSNFISILKLITSYTDLIINDLYLTEDRYVIYTRKIDYL